MAARLRVPGEVETAEAARTVAARWADVRVLLVVLPFGVMAGVAVVDVLAGPRFGFLPLLSLGPALAAVSVRPLGTALVGGLALVVCLLLASYDDLLGSQRMLIALVTVAGVTAGGVVASAGRHRRERDLADVSAVAEAAQQVLLHPVPAQVGAVQVAVRYVSASAAARIGGDLYEVIAAPSAVRLIVGDVLGKGLAAVQTAAVVLGAFREAAYEAAGLAEIAARIERSLQRQQAVEEFVTAIVAQVPTGRAEIEILNCGHPPPLLLTGGSARFTGPPEAGLPLGLADLAVSPRKTHVVGFGPGQRMLFYTDGISEARDSSGAFYPLDRCPALLAGQDPGAALDRLRDDVIHHVGHRLHDDAAMLLLSPRPGATQAANGQARAATST